LPTYTRDEWARRSQLAMSGIGSHGRFVHLYINGAYWGLYNLVERLDTDFAAANLGGEPEDWFSVTQGGMRPGMPDRFLVMLDLARSGNLADPERYATMLEFIDPIQFSDYVILQWYMGNRDWPENNWTVNVQYPAGRNLFFVWDAEDIWHAGAEVRLGVDEVEDAPFPNVVKLVFEALWENPDFRVLFADRLFAQLHHAGALTDAHAQARWQALNAEIENAVAAESARWGAVRYAEPITPDDWAHARDLVLVQMDGNAARLIELARAAGYYPAPDAPLMSQPGGAFDGTLALTLDSGAGADAGANDAAIYFTLDGSDPRMAGTGEIAPTAQRYTAAIDLDDATVVTARSVVTHAVAGTPAAPVWSAANVAHFWRTEQVGDVRITEIMYNPAGGGDFEFVEIMNTGELAVDLSGAFFEGIEFRFVEYRSIAAGERMVFVRDFSAFRSRYPEASIHGVFEGRLSNQGEYLALRTRTGTVLDALTYGVDERWPISAGGAGDSLTRHSLVEDPNLPQSWRASAVIHGSPGAPDGTQVAGPTAAGASDDASGASGTGESGE
ncbi:MAG: CotH kinase family protein, partial [Litorilinea sp.]